MSEKYLSILCSLMLVWVISGCGPTGSTGEAGPAVKESAAPSAEKSAPGTPAVTEKPTETPAVAPAETAKPVETPEKEAVSKPAETPAKEAKTGGFASKGRKKTPKKEVVEKPAAKPVETAEAPAPAKAPETVEKPAPAKAPETVEKPAPAKTPEAVAKTEPAKPVETAQVPAAAPAKKKEPKTKPAKPVPSKSEAAVTGTSPFAVDKQLAALGKVAEKKPFIFAVIGDNRTGDAQDRISQPEAYKKIVADIAGLENVDFVINVGDLIYGGTTDADTGGKMWDAFEEASLALKKPYLLIPGNHDVSKEPLGEIYEKRFGRRYYSFDYKGAHFIALDSEAKGAVSLITGAQLTWLKSDLGKQKGVAPIFVFLHKPLWSSSRNLDQASNWKKDIHSLLVQGGVTAVFAGHDHLFKDDGIVDGIHYYVTGGAGAPLSGIFITGGFNHYMVVSVGEDRKFTAQVFQPGRKLVDTSLLMPSAKDALADVAKSLLAETYTLDKFPLTTKVAYSNTMALPVKLDATWSIAGQAWTVEPMSTQATIEKGNTTEIPAKISLTGTGRRFPYPVPLLTLKMSAGESDLGSAKRPLRVKFIREAQVPVAEGEPEIDGVMEPGWDEAAVHISGFILEDGTYLAYPPTEVWVTRTSDKLLMFFKCHEKNVDKLRTKAAQRDDAVWSDDSVEVFITAPDGNGEKYYHFLVSAAGVIEDAVNKDDSWNGDWQVKTKVNKDSWTAEIGVPASTLGVKTFDGVKELRVNFCRNRFAGGEQISAWNCTYGSFHSPELFGRLKF